MVDRRNQCNVLTSSHADTRLPVSEKDSLTGTSSYKLSINNSNNSNSISNSNNNSDNDRNNYNDESSNQKRKNCITFDPNNVNIFDTTVPNKCKGCNIIPDDVKHLGLLLPLNPFLDELVINESTKLKVNNVTGNIIMHSRKCNGYTDDSKNKQKKGVCASCNTTCKMIKKQINRSKEVDNKIANGTFLDSNIGDVHTSNTTRKLESLCHSQLIALIQGYNIVKVLLPESNNDVKLEGKYSYFHIILIVEYFFIIFEKVVYRLYTPYHDI